MSYKQLKLIWNKLLKQIWWVKGFIVLLLLKFVRTSFLKSFIVQNNVQLSTPKYFHCKSYGCCFYASTGLIFLLSHQPEFLVALVSELADATKSQVARMAAGLQLKNQLTSKDAAVRLQYQQRWMTLDDKIKNHVKTMVRNLVELKCVLLYQVIPGFTPGLKLI